MNNPISLLSVSNRLPRVVHRSGFLAAALAILSAAPAAAAPLLQQLSPVPRTYTWGTGTFGDFTQGEGPIADVTGFLSPVDLMLPPGTANSSTSGCEAADFAGYAAGTIALLQRGACGFNVKVQNAAAAGAIGALIFNEGQPDRLDTIEVTFGTGAASIPWFFTSFAVGSELAFLSNGPSVIIRMRTEETDTTFQVPGAIPEPGTWAMLIVGFGAIGATMRRRRTDRTFRLKGLQLS